MHAEVYVPYNFQHISTNHSGVSFYYFLSPKLRENIIKELIIRSQFLSNSVNNEMTKEICTIIVFIDSFHYFSDNTCLFN
uniref:Uncharacterized protein n=1 Tax=Wuchereria bancrofti TaxID=6293 RepID=A0A1I8EUM8_WUCBA